MIFHTGSISEYHDSCLHIFYLNMYHVLMVIRKMMET